jgi:hypothetical protein
MDLPKMIGHKIRLCGRNAVIGKAVAQPKMPRLLSHGALQSALRWIRADAKRQIQKRQWPKSQ